MQGPCNHDDVSDSIARVTLGSLEARGAFYKLSPGETVEPSRPPTLSQGVPVPLVL